MSEKKELLDPESLMEIGNGEVVGYRRAARLINALEESKATYQSLEMRLRSWSHNRTFPSWLLKTGETDPLIAKMMRVAVTAGLTALTVKWLGGVDFGAMKEAATNMAPEFLIPAVAATAAGIKGYVSKLTFDTALQAPRLYDYVRFNWQLRKIDNRKWFHSHVQRLEGNPFHNFKELQAYCREVVKEVQPAKQTDLIKKAVETTHQLDFWAKDLAIRIGEAACKEPVNLKTATMIALNAAPWATKTLKDLEIKDMTVDDPTAYGRSSFKRTYTAKDQFAAGVNFQDLDLFEDEDKPLQGNTIRDRIAGMSARFENAMSRNATMSNLLTGDGAAVAIALTGSALLTGITLSGGNEHLRVAAAYLNNHAALSSSMMIGSMAVQTPLRLAQMADKFTLTVYRARNQLERMRMRMQEESWNDGMTDLSLDQMREMTAQKLDRWRELQGVMGPSRQSDETERLARDLLIEKLLNTAMQYKLQQPRLPLDVLITGIVHEHGFDRTASKPLESSVKNKVTTMPFNPKKLEGVDMVDRIHQHTSQQNDPPEAKKRSLSL